MGADYEAGLEVLELFEQLVAVDPQMPGVRHPTLDDHWVFVTPAAIRRLPKFVITYTIETVDGVVVLWNLNRLD